MELELYHGTSARHMKDIKIAGLKEPYLTNSLDLAKYYAEVTSEEDGTKPIIMKVRVSEKLLSVDFHALEEPVGFDDKTSYELEDQVGEIYELLGEIKDREYHVSLNTVGSCRYNGIISQDNIEIVNSIN